jgi:hypothetical protein
MKTGLLSLLLATACSPAAPTNIDAPTSCEVQPGDAGYCMAAPAGYTTAWECPATDAAIWSPGMTVPKGACITVGYNYQCCLADSKP